MRALKNKLTLVVLAVIAFMAFGMGVVFMPKTATAEVTKDNGFYIEDGASVRTEAGQSGIKWTAHLTAAGKDFVIGDSGAEITQIGIVIKPSAKADSFAIEYPCEGVNFQFSETKTEIVYSYAIYYDSLYKDLTDTYPEMEHEDKLALVDQAYTTNLEAKPYVKLSNGETVYGDVYDTSRSIRGLALYFLLDGRYAGLPEEDTLKSYMPAGKFNLVEERANNDDSLNYYSVVDNAGLVRLTDIPVDEATRAYIGAKEISSMIDADAGVINLAGIEGTPGQDYTVSVLCSNGDVYNVDFTYATLAIDEIADFSYFKLKSNVYWGANGSYGYTAWSWNFPDANEYIWDGYYMLLNDIDATGYTHDMTAGKAINSSNNGVIDFTTNIYGSHADYLANRTGLKGNGVEHGFSGTFDGRGHTITNLKTQATGLLGHINGGHVKNLGFVIEDGSGITGKLAYSMLRGAKLTNVYCDVDNTLPTGGSTYGPLVTTIGPTCWQITNVVINDDAQPQSKVTWSYKVGSLTGDFERKSTNQPVPFGVGPGKEAHRAFDGYYVVSQRALIETIPANADPVTGKQILLDAEYVDGVKNETIYTFTYADGTGATKQIAAQGGAKRYTSIDAFKADAANNDFTSWDSNYWTVVDGVPVFNSCIEDSLISVTLNGENTTQVFTGETATVAIKYNGGEVSTNKSLTVVSGEGVTVNGNELTFNAMGEVVLKVGVNGVSKLVTVTVNPPLTEIEQEYKFSAYDGLFFDDNYNVVSLENVIESDAKIDKVLDNNDNALTVTDGAVLGFDTSAKDWQEGYLVFYTENSCIKVYVQIAELIIDEATDLGYFHNVDFKAWGNGNYILTAIFDGYYILAKDIDANGYVHDFNRGSAAFSPNGAGYNFYKNEATKPYLVDTGLTGTFEGNGHAIKNLKITEVGGLFGYINGGTVKNVAFVNFKTVSASNTGGLCAYMFEKSTLQDTYWYCAETMNGGWNTQMIMSGAYSGAIIERNVVFWDRSASSGNYYTGAASGIVTEGYANATFKDFYYINHSPVNYSGASTYTVTKTDDTTTSVGLRKVTADAKYVDGVERSTAETKFYETWNWGGIYDLSKYKSIGTYTGSYNINLIEGMKRYTSLDKLKADKANNDFSNWSADIWAVVDGYPKFSSQITDELTFDIGEQAVVDNAVEISSEASYKVTASFGGVKAYNPVSSVEIVSGAEFISVEGDVITANALGNAVVKVAFGDEVATVNVTVVKPTDPYEKELQFSVIDANFFDGADVLSLDQIVGDAEILSVTDGEGNALSIEDGKVMGITTSTEKWEEKAIVFETEEKFIKVNVKVAKYIIDEKEDFAYFVCKEEWDYSKTTTYAYTFTDGDFDWEGYYVLAKNIDATGYTHNWDAGLGSQGTVSSITANRMDYLAHDGIQYHETAVPNDHGFNGTFDGQGYTISNLTTDDNGLFGAVTGAVIKNLGLINCNATSGKAPLAYIVAGSTKLENIFVSTSTGFSTASHAPLFADWSSTIYNVKNVVVYDNTIIPTDKTYPWSFGYGSVTVSAGRDATNQAPGFGPSSSWSPGMTSMIIVSPTPMSVAVAANTNYLTYTTRMDAKYIDGVLNENVYNCGKTYTEVPAIGGVYRFTSQETLTANAGTVTARLNELVATGLFNVDNGVITWVNAPVA